VLYSDFECSFCRRQEEVLKKLLTLYPERVRLVWKHFPLSRLGGGRAAAETAECARRQGRFWELHDLLLEGPVRRRERDLEQAALAAGVDLERLRADLPGCRVRVDADIAEGQGLGVESPPTLFVNGLRLVGMRPLPELRLLVEEETAPGLLDQLTGDPP
jgi:protein-disulfide isomerase